MKTVLKNLSIATLLISLVTAAYYSADAQETTVWKQHRHTLEVSTGIPYPMFIHSDAGPEPGSQEELEFFNMWNNGLSKKRTMYPNLTITYSFRLAVEGEVSVFCNIHGYTYAICQHPEGYTPGLNWNYDASTVTEVLERGYVNMAIVPGFIFKYYWYNKEFWKWYSGIGLGFFAYGHDVLTDLRVSPEIILAGTHFGRNRVYGVADFVLGPSGLGPQLGLGYRF